MASQKKRECPICGKVVAARGLTLHLSKAHGLKGQELRDAMDRAPAPSSDAETLDLVEKLIDIEDRRRTLDELEDRIPRGAYATAYAEYLASAISISERLSELHPEDESGDDTPLEHPLDRQHAIAAFPILRSQGVDFAGPFKGDEATSRMLVPMVRLGWIEAEQLDLNSWRFSPTDAGKRAWGVFEG